MLCKAMQIQGIPIPQYVMKKLNVLQDVKEDVYFYYSIKLAYFTWAQEAIIKMNLDSYVS